MRTAVLNRKRKSVSQKRRYLLEQLESRQLLNADDPLSQQQHSALNADLGSLTDFASHVESAEALQRELALVGRTFDGQLDFSDSISVGFVNPLLSFIGAEPTAAPSPNAIIDQIQNQLPGLLSTGAELAVGPTSVSTDGELVFDTTLFVSETATPSLDLDEAGKENGLFVTDSAELDTSFIIELNMRFGVDATGNFFTEVSGLDFEVTATAELIADDPTPLATTIVNDVDFTILINDQTSIQTTLPAHTIGNLTSIADRLNNALSQPLADAGFTNKLTVVESQGRLAIRSTSADIRQLQIIGPNVSLLGFTNGAVAQNEFNPEVDYGLLGLKTVEGGVSILAGVSVAVDDGGDGRLSATELGATPTLAETRTGAAEVSLQVQPATGSFNAGTPSISIAQASLFGTSNTDVALNAFDDVDLLQSQATATLSDGFAAITEFGSRLESQTPLATSLPAMDTTLAEQVGLNALLQEKLQDTIQSLLNSNARPSWADVEAALSSVEGVSVNASDATAQELSLSLQVTDTKTSSQKLDYGQAAEEAGFNAVEEALPDFALEASTDWSLQIGIDRTATASTLDAFAITFDQANNSAVINNQAVAFDANVGFLGVNATGTANLNATLATTVNNGQEITAAELLANPVSDLVTTAETGTFGLALALGTTLGSQTFNASLALPAAPVFGGQSELQPAGFDSVSDFANVTSNDLAGAIEQLEGWLGDFSDQNLRDAIPLAGASFAEAVDLQSIFKSQFVDLLKDADGNLQIASAQDFLALAPISNVNYDSANQELTFDVTISGQPIAPLVADLDFNVELGEFIGVSTEADITLTTDLDIVFGLGIDLTPLGSGPGSLTISEGTFLSSINDGMGIMDIDTGSGDDIEITLRNGTNLLVSFDGDQTLGDVKDRLDAISNLTATIEESRIRIEDHSVGTQVFSIAAVEGSLAGLGMGILGEADDTQDDGGAAVIVGNPLHGDTFANHLFIQEKTVAGQPVPIAMGTVSLAAPSFSATANLGFTEVTIGKDGALGGINTVSNQLGVEIPSYVSAAVGLPQPKMTLAELFDALKDNTDAAVDAVAEFTGAIEIELPTFAVFSGDSGEQEESSSIVANIDFQSLVDLDEIVASIDGSFDGVLKQLQRVDVGDVLDAMRDGLDRLLSGENLNLPLLNIDLPDAAGLKSLITKVTDAIDSVGDATLDVLSEVMNSLAKQGDADAPDIDFPELDVSLPDLFAFFGESQSMAPEQGTNETFSLPDFGALFTTHFDFEVNLPDVTVDADQFATFLSGLTQILDGLQLSGPGNLQALEQLLENAIGLDDDGISLQIITNSATAGAIEVRFDINLGQSIDATYPLSIDLADLGVSGIGDLVDVNASSTVMLNAGIDAVLSLGLEISSNESVEIKPFLYTDAAGTRLTLTADASATDIDFGASIGPLGIEVENGSAGIGPASFALTFDDADERYFFLDESLNLETAAGAGSAFAHLPISLPIGDPIYVALEVADLTAPDPMLKLKDATFQTDVDHNNDSMFDKDDVADAFSDAISSLGNIGDNLLSLVGGWEGAFDLLTDTMRGEVLGVPLPFIGDALANEADFLDEIKRSVLDNIENLAELGTGVVQTEIFNALGPGGLDLLKDNNGDLQVTVDDVVAVTTGLDRVDFDIKLGESLKTIDLPINFDLGLPGLNLDIDAPVELDFGFEFNLGFGVSIDEGFYIQSDTTDLTVSFDAVIPELDASGQLALLGVTAKSGIHDVTGLPETRFAGAFEVTLSEPSGDNLLTLSEMFASDFSDIVQHELSAYATADLDLVASIGNNDVLPSIRTDLRLEWGFGGALSSPPVGSSVTTETPIVVDFNNVQLNIGEFFGGFAGDVLGRVQDVLEPVQPVIDVLTARLPVISDLSGSKVTLVDLARMFGRADVANFIQSVIDVNELITSLPDPSSLDGENAWIDLGQFSVDGSLLGGFDPTATGTPMVKDVTVASSSEADVLGELGNRGGQGATWKNNLQGSGGGKLSFPLIQNPLTAFNLLLGKDVDLFLYDAPALGIDFAYNQSFPTPIPGLFAEFGGRIAAVADFAFGLDTTGISKFKETGFVPDIFDGFFVSDRINADGTGSDVPEVYLRGSLTAGAKINLLLAEAGVRGGIYADVNFNLHDNDRDGKVRASEIAENFDLGPIHIFDVNGKVDAGLTAFYRVLFFSDEFEIARVNLLDFSVTRPASGAPSAESILTSRSGDVLTLQFTQQDDTYKVLPGSQPNSIIVQGRGMQTGDIVGITSIVGDALDGNDKITISPDVFLPVTLDGGAGNDELTAGGGPATLRGGTGDDQLTGGNDGDLLEGGDDDDVLIGGRGNDTLRGGAGDDYLDGGHNEDDLQGDDGNDQLFGGLNADEVDGGAGDDVIEGGRGNDVLRGGAGKDEISGNRGDDQIFGDAGDDMLYGNEGADVIYGGSDHDIIDGGERNDMLSGGTGNDTILGGSGGDGIFGGEGDDDLRGNGGSDQISGDAGNDMIFAADDQNGEAADASHTISGGEGDDLIYGSLGVDTIDAGIGNDMVYALDGDDVIVGGLGDDDLNGGEGHDLIWGGLAAYASSNFDLGNASNFTEPNRFAEATALGGSSYTLPLLITPTVVAGFSVSGNSGDGADILRGDAGNDWLFGGSDSDTAIGGVGHDYIDGGSGDDSNLFGGDGDDIVRGGSGSDVVHGNAGIDQVYGDSGRDTLYGDEGDAGGSTDGQRLFGGDDADSLYAWASTDSVVNEKGDELYGGTGSDFLYGNLRNELLMGENGPDYLSGDWAAGPDYTPNVNSAIDGANDTLNGGGGQDQLYGGGGDDDLIGGGDSDWIEGQNGEDNSFGGAGIDFMILDVNPEFADVGGDTFDGHGDGTIDDFATDVMMINGTAGDDIITIESVGEKIRVTIDGHVIDADWLDAKGNPLVEQFRVEGGAGDDTIEFADNFDVSKLINRSLDWVTVINGGSGDDTITGSAARDRIDGGQGSDTIFGNASDDRLWGDQGPEHGRVSDHDVIYAGQGNDDVLGGQGTNALYAWSNDPGAPGAEDFGVFVDVGGELQLEDTGLNRIIGGPNDDELFGGTGLDLLFGGEGENQLYTRSGMAFETLDGGDAGDAWKDYARSTGQAWYVGGSNGNDEISVDFVTEPGFLLGHHLVTRLTTNGDVVSFDAQVRLDFSAIDDDGNLIWDPNRLFSIGDPFDDDPFARANLLNSTFSDAAALSRILPPEGDFRAIIIDALDGDDIINVGPTVQKSVWVDAGDGNDEVVFASGRAALIDQTDPVSARNDTRENAFPLNGSPSITAISDGPANGQITEDANFFLIVDDLSEHVLITVPAADTDGTAVATEPNESLEDLVADINRIIEQTAAAGRVLATLASNQIVLFSTSPSGAAQLDISIDALDSAATQLGLPTGITATPTQILSRSVRYTGLTIDNPSDQDFYRFQVAANNTLMRINLPSAGVDDGMTFNLFAGTSVVPEVAIDSVFTLQSGIDYTLQVQSNLIPTIYEIELDFLDGLEPLVTDLASPEASLRKDVIFGGGGNDVLRGGPGEDFIFGGTGDDILSGGDDRGASDLLFGQEGDDKFQTVPGGLPVLKGTTTTFLPTASDRYDGGVGNDQVVYLGGDIDENGQPINDLAAIRVNRFLQRYEISDVAWDTANQQQAVDENGDQIRRWHFFTVQSIEGFTADLQAGDDFFHANTGYTFANDDSEWGLAEGDRQAAGGSLLTIRIAGGDGDDELFGSPFNDILIGGNGEDVLAGGWGDDTLDGGADNDTLLGQRLLEVGNQLDVVEYYAREDLEFPREAFQIPKLRPGQKTGTINSGSDFLLQLDNENTFYDQTIPAFAGDRISVTRTNNGVPEVLDVDIQRVINEGTAESPLWIVMEDFDTRVPDRYLVEADAPFQVEFQGDEIGNSVHASVDQLTQRDPITREAVTGFSRTVFDLGDGAEGIGTVISVGDFDGDGFEDFILTADGFRGDGSAFMYYGGSNILDPTVTNLSGQPVTRINLTGVLLDASSTTPVNTFGTPGDLDGDGIDDLVLSTNRPNDAGFVSIIFGGERVNELNISGTPTVGRVVQLSGFAPGVSGYSRIHASAIGDVDNVADTEGRKHDDLIVVDSANAYVYGGRSRADWATAAPTLVSPTNGHSVTGLGDVDGDGNVDFGTVGDQQLQVFFGDGTLAGFSAESLDAPQTNAFQNSTIYSSQLSQLGEGDAQAIISGRPQDILGSFTGSETSYLIDIDSNRSLSIRTTSPTHDLRAIGDFNGDGHVDYATHAFVKFNANASGLALPFTRTDTHVYLSGEQLYDRLSNGNPDIVLARPDSGEFDNFNEPPLRTPVLNSVGDVNGDGRDDLGIFSPHEQKLTVIFGSPTGPTISSLQAPSIAENALLGQAWVAPLSVDEQYAQPGIDLNAPTSLGLADAITVDGNRSDVKLDGVRSIGDINGDGHVDFVLTTATDNWEVGSDYEFLLMGPFTETGITDIDVLSNFAFDSDKDLPDQLFQINGHVVQGSGDITGDGVDDLVISRRNCDVGSATTCATQIVVTEGGSNVYEGLLVENDAFNYTDTGQDPSTYVTHAEYVNWHGTTADDVLIWRDNNDSTLLARVVSIESNVSTAVGLTLNTSLLTPPAGRTVNTEASFSAHAIGDINGDGKEDIAIASPDLYSPFAEVGAAFIILGGSTSDIQIATQADHQLVIPGGAQGLDALGDIDGDGYDDFALYRTVEGADDQQGSVLIYRGSDLWSQATTPEPWVRISEADLSSVVTISHHPRTRVAAGDLNHDGKTDLVIGIPAVGVRVDGDEFGDRDGRASVFFDIASFATSESENIVYYQDADRTYQGTNSERLGVLRDSRLADYNSDGIDDLWIGTPGRSFGIPGSGKARFIPGVASSTNFDSPDAVILQNRGNLLVDTETGQPILFEGDDLTLSGDQEETWYQFTTGGDGQSTGALADYVRVEASDPTTDLRIDLFDADGRVFESEQTLIDLRNAKANTYFLRVYRTNNTTSELPFLIEFDPPSLGAFHTSSDNDRLLGGLGDDKLIGDDDIDVNIGGGGIDRPRESDPLQQNDLLQFDRQQEDVASFFEFALTDGQTDYSVDPNGVQLPSVRQRIAETLGHPITFDSVGQPVLHQPWYASKLAQIETLDLSNLGLTMAPDLSLLPNLRHVDLSGNQLTMMPEVAPKWQTLNLDDNPISSLLPLIGTTIVQFTAGETYYTTSENAFDGDYQAAKHDENDQIGIRVPNQEIEVYVSWPNVNVLDSNVTYQIFDRIADELVLIEEVTVDASEAPQDDAGDGLGGRPWMSLGRFTLQGLYVGAVTPAGQSDAKFLDAVRVDLVEQPQLNLKHLSFINSPLDAVSRDYVVPEITTESPDLVVDLTENDFAPQIDSVDLERQSLRFDDDVVVLDPEIFNGQSSFMVEFWYKTDSIEYFHTLFNTSGPTVSEQDQFLVYFDSATEIGIQNSNFDLALFDSPQRLDDGQWHHYAIVRDTSAATPKAAVFVDGVLLGEQNLVGGSAPLDVHSFVLGHDLDSPGGSYSSSNGITGELDDFIAWSEYWDQNDPNAQHLAKIQDRDLADRPIDPDMLAYFKFNEFAGDRVIDATGSSENGVLGDSDGEVASDVRPAPERIATYRISTVDGNLVDQDGQAITFSATDNNFETDVSIEGDLLFVDVNQDVVSTTEIVVTASDDLGRQTRLAFDHNADIPTDRGAGQNAITPFTSGKVVIESTNEPVAGAIVHLVDLLGQIIACGVTDLDGNYRVSENLSQTVHHIEVATPEQWIVIDTPRVVADQHDFEYEFDVDPSDPSQVDHDQNGSADLRLVNGPTIQDGVISLATDQNIGENNETDSVWTNNQFTVASGYTIDFRLRVDDSVPEGPRGAFSLLAAPSDSDVNSFLSLGRNKVVWAPGVHNISLSTDDNSREFHDYRIVQAPGTFDFYVWRDGELLNPNGDPLPGFQFNGFSNRMIMGDGGANDFGRTEMDYLRLSKGLPFTEAGYGPQDFQLVQNLDIGDDIAIAEGTTHTFTAASTLTLTGHAWTVSQDGTTLATGSGQSFDFTPPNTGQYLVTVTATDGEANLMDSTSLFANDAAPVVVVTTPNVLPANEGDTVSLIPTVTDVDAIVSYRWSATDQFGNEVDALEGNGPAPAWSLTREDEGIFDVTLSVTDSDGDKGVGKFGVVFANVLPDLLLSSSSTATTGNFLLEGQFFDPGADLWLGTVDFGDGTSKPVVIDEDVSGRSSGKTAGRNAETDGTFAIQHQYEQAGTYQVTVTIDDQDGGSRQETFEVTYNPEIEITDIEINDGAAQRSSITSVDLTFNQIVDAPESAFVLRNRDTGVEVTSFEYLIDNSSGATELELTFLPGPSVVTRNDGNSLADGNYELIISSNQIEGANPEANKLPQDVVFGLEETDGFFRMYGDSDGDRDVDVQDLGNFGLTFRKSTGEADFDAVHDFDGDGDVDVQDLGEFGKRFRNTLEF